MRYAAALVIGCAITASLFAAENTKDPGKDGPYPAGWITAEILDSTKPGENLAAVIYYPAEAAEVKSPPGSLKAPWPVLIFSPGGPAKSYDGYEDVAIRMASWGVVTVLVAFGDRPPEKRAPQFPVVRDWLEKKNAETGFPLKGKLNLIIVFAGGHSPGGAAAVLAAE